VYPEVITTAFPESHYHQPLGGYGLLTKEVLERIDAKGFDFDRFDHNGDGLIDQIFIVVRRDTGRQAHRFAWTGASCLDARCAPGPPHGPPIPPLVLDGKRVDWNLSGSYIIHRTPGNINPFYYMVRLMAHELGHDLWARYFVHVPAITNNDVPLESNRSRQGTAAVGYVLMAGAGGGWDCRGNETISAFERDLLGWIDCPSLQGDTRGLSLSDLYSTSACYSLLLNGDSGGRRLYLSNLQRIGPFDRFRTGGARSQYELGLLRTTGMLVSLIDGVRFDLLPADNTLDLAITNSAYHGDLFSTDTRIQLTPWTRPNINGYTLYPSGFVPDWHAIDNIHYKDEASHTILFDVIKDFRENPIIRSDSWIGNETFGHQFKANMRVTHRSTLTINTSLSFSRRLRIDSGARVIVAEGARIKMKEGSTLDVRNGGHIEVKGSLILNGVRTLFPGGEIIVAPSGRIGRSSK